MRKLTLTADEKTIALAKKIAQQNRTSVSSMFGRFVRLMAGAKGSSAPIGPIARKATGLVSLPRGKTERDILVDALLDKYGLLE